MSIKDKGNSGLVAPSSPMFPSGDVPEGVSFDGSTDYLSRSGSLYTSTKTVTLSGWLYKPKGNHNTILFDARDNGYNSSVISCYLGSNNTLSINFWSTFNSGSYVFYANISNIPDETFINVLLSFDGVNNLKYLYINEKSYPCTLFTNRDVATNLVDFSYIGRTTTGLYAKGRLSHLFLDYTYRDLSIVANRRLFITADGKPASGLETLNPILYLPMKDKATAHLNLGTGGDFVQNGLIETADRGANQDNCKASLFDGTNDQLHPAVVTKYLAPRSFTVNLIFNANTNNGGILYTSPGGGTGTSIAINNSNELCVNFQIGDSDVVHGNLKLIAPIFLNKEYHLTVSVYDTQNISTGGYYVQLNGKNMTATTIIDFDPLYISSGTSPYLFSGIYVGYANATNGGTVSGYLNGTLGECYIDVSPLAGGAYFDLATNNPFWDSDTNKPIPVRTAMANLGSNPLICMPIDASNPTKNYGSGGDFVLGGGGLTGARGASEFIARSADCGISNTDYLSIDSPITIPDTKTYSVVFSLYVNDNYLSIYPLAIYLDDSAGMLYLNMNLTDAWIDIKGANSSGTQVLWKRFDLNTAFTYNNWYSFYICVDMDNEANISAGSFNSVPTINTAYVFTPSSLLRGDSKALIGAGKGGAGATTLFGSYSTISNVYFTTDYIDFSQEANRNLFVNQLGYPRDLTPEIDAGNIPTPIIYLPFDDTANLGKNLGTGGDFTVNGNCLPGQDFQL